MNELNSIAQKESSYYSLVRKEIVDLIPIGTKRILDVGCGDGSTGFAAKLRGGG